MQDHPKVSSVDRAPDLESGCHGFDSRTAPQADNLLPKEGNRREETAAMRSQANTAKLLADNPTLMRLRELEVLEKVATTGNLNVVLGERGLADRVVNLL